jgi:hypothetical protein
VSVLSHPGAVACLPYAGEALSGLDNAPLPFTRLPTITMYFGRFLPFLGRKKVFVWANSYHYWGEKISDHLENQCLDQFFLA